ncbi:CBS domain-containing protein [Hyperthermus butylicus]|uniref:Universally conserved protein n=1 Tax=Hyperthermus butylicus (strain DSM 5456 / JCM 9403 / PLM1-5) TaxID=415426 RepID=A2BMX8_HYPBU|nr:CBS domain-containing protein [Hyperthermus butylicus]ABM81339.1 universally conserved protein [Hyperthermus butylicus DSM 5456]
MPLVTARDLIRDSRLVYAFLDGTITDAVKRKTEPSVGSVPVVGHDMRLLGIFTERDPVGLIASDESLDRSLGEVMMWGLGVAHPDDSLPSTAYKMVRHGARHTPVVDEDDRLLCVVSIRRVPQYMLAGSE